MEILALHVCVCVCDGVCVCVMVCVHVCVRWRGINSNVDVNI